MATPTQRIYSDAAAPLPASYVAPGGLDIEFASVRARINGAGASSSFIVVLELLTNDGRIMTQSRIDQVFAVGDTVSATWAPFLRRAARPRGEILQTYVAQATAADFTFDSTVFVASGYPANPTLTKLSDTSILDIVCLADFTNSAIVPNCIFCGVFIDGSNEATVGMHASLASFFLTAPVVARRGAGFSSGAPFAAGAHTVELKVAHGVAGANSVLRCSTSVELTIMEYEP